MEGPVYRYDLQNRNEQLILQIGEWQGC